MCAGTVPTLVVPIKPSNGCVRHQLEAQLVVDLISTFCAVQRCQCPLPSLHRLDLNLRLPRQRDDIVRDRKRRWRDHGGCAGRTLTHARHDRPERLARGAD